MRHVDLYVACFSQQPNVLPQWRGYCPKGGYSLGFAFNELVQLCDRSADSTFAACVYEKEDRGKLVDSMVNSILDRFEQRTSPSRLFIDPIEIDTLTKITSSAALIKNEHFREEEEWRFITLGRDVNFRPGRFGLTPYTTVNLDYVERENPRYQEEGATKAMKVLKCKSLTVGPSSDMETSLLAAKSFGVRKLGLLPHEITYCNIPYKI